MERSVGNVNGEFLTCTICRHAFTDPRSLPCLHSFCKRCISEHIIKTTKGQSTPNGFDCPSCKRFVNAPDTHAQPDAWADRLAVSHLINNLMNSVRLRNDVSKCDPCFRRKEKATAAKWCKECAEALCEKCVSFHRSLKYSKNHMLMDFEDLRQQPIKNTLPRPPCLQHDNTTLGFFCEDHQKVCCSACVTMDHRKCAHVTTSVDAAAKHKADVNGLSEKLQQQKGWSSRILENRQHSIKMLDDAETQLTKQITSIRGQFDEMLRAQEKKILEELHLLKALEREEYGREMNKCEEMICTTGNALNIVKNSMQHGTDSDVLISVNSVKKEADECEKDLTEMSDNLRDILLIFTPDRHLSQLLANMKDMGRISYSHTPVQVAPPYNIAVRDINSPDSVSTETSRSLSPPVLPEIPLQKIVEETPRSSRMSGTSRNTSRRSTHDSRANFSGSSEKLFHDTPTSKASKVSAIFKTAIEDENGTPFLQVHGLLSPMTPMGRKSDRRMAANAASLEFYFKARSVHDRENCILSGATYLPDGRVVLVDQMLRKLKLYDQAFRWMGEKVLPARPYDAAHVNDNEVAVTFPREKRIQVFAVRVTGFLPTFTINTGAKCWGVSYSPSYKRFAVCCYTQPPCVKIFSRSEGKEIKSMSREKNGAELFYFPDYVAMDNAGRNLYITDKYKKSVIAMTMDGDKRWEFSYHGLKNPRGIAVHGNCIYVAGCRSHNVLLLTTDGEIAADVIIEGISFPNKICLSPTADRLLVTQFQGTLVDIERNTVKIYRLD